MRFWHDVKRIFQALLLVLASILGVACFASPAYGQKQSREAEYRQELVVWLSTTQPIATPAEWRVWWDSLTTECECHPAVAFEQLHISILPRTFKVPRSMREVAGAWIGAGYVVFAQDFLTDPRVVKHEMLHVMLGPANFTVSDMHPDIFRKLRLDAEWLQLAS